MATIHKRKTGGGEVVWELTHGTGRDRQRFVAGRTRQEAEATLSQFTRQVALHGDAPDNVSVTEGVARYVAWLRTNRRKSTQRRYARVLHTFDACFLKVFHCGVRTLRDVRPSQLEDYKERRSAGGIREADSPDALEREAALRARLSASPQSPNRKDNAAYGWLGRKRRRTRGTQCTGNDELRALYTFFR